MADVREFGNPKSTKRRVRRPIFKGSCLLATLLLAACASQDFGQIYYLGVYDPNEELTQRPYHVTI